MSDNALKPKDDALLKKYPVSTSEVSKMLGLESPHQDLPMGSFQHNHTEVHALPQLNSHGAEHQSNNNHAVNLAASSSATPKSAALLNAAKTVAPFAAVFVVGIFLYFFFFSSVNLNLSSVLTPSGSNSSTPQATALSQLEKQDAANYQVWIKSFYYDISDPKLLDPDSDNSGNGLTNFQKYLLDLNPKSYDTLGSGMADSQALANGINPNSGLPLTDQQKSLLAKYVDMEVVMNRLALNNMQNPGRVAGASITAGGNQTGAINGDAVTNIRQPISYSQNSLYANLDINTAVAGRLEIPSLNINVPIIWSSSANDFENDLQMGVIHYPGTAMPGQIGTTYIAGHSSNYVWAKGSYNEVFSKLGNLADNASFKITVAQKNGKNAVLYYTVSGRGQYTPTDPAQFQNSGKSIVELSTCWPVGSTAKRLVVYGQLTQVQN